MTAAITPSDPPLKGTYRLRTFGTLSLTDPENRTHLGKDGHQHRRLALLAMLAAAGSEGRSRDQLLLFFWPDSTQEKARHSLEQLLYAIRRSMDQPPFTGTNPVRLNFDVVSSDIADFRAALAARSLEDAVALYRGPFLDGFYLADSPEFEQWVESERSNLERLYTGAIEQLARAAEQRKDYAQAVHWWRKLSDTDPLGSKTASGLMRALMNAGDHAAALQHADRYEAIARRELGMSAGPQISEMVAEVRAAMSAQTLPKTGFAAPASTDTVLPSTEPLATTRSRHTIAPVLAALVIAILIGGGGWLGSHLRAGTSATPAPSIAVLPFQNVNGSKEDAVFVNGLTEEMINELARIRNLRVIGRTSAAAFANSSIGAKRIADSLGVANLLEGSVEKSGDQLRVQVRLVDGRDGATRWSQTYDRGLRDIFGVQSDIATAVARELDIRLTQTNLARIERPSTRNIAAYEMFLRGNDQILLRSDSGARVALQYFQNAVALDSGYADAHAGIARMEARLAFGGDTQMTRHDRLVLAEQEANKAVALDDLSAEAHAALGLMQRNNYRMASAEAQLKRAVALDPTNAHYRQWLVQLYIFTGRPLEALREARTGLELDALSPVSNAEFAHALLANDRPDEALQRLRVLTSLRPPLLRASNFAAQCYASKGMWPQAIAALRAISSVGGPGTQGLLGYLLGRNGNTAEARKILATLLAESTSANVRGYQIATVYAGLGDKERAFNWLNKAIDDRSIDWDDFQTVRASLDGDPRWAAFMRHFDAQNR